MFNFELFSANAVSFIPVYLSYSNGTIRKPYAGDTFSLSPTAAAKKSTQTRKFPN